MSKTSLPAAFVTFGWCRSTYTVVRSLAVRGVRVYVGDSSRVAMSRFSRYASGFSRLPDFYLEPENYVKELALALSKHKARVLLPCFEDVKTILEHRNLLPDDIQIALPSLPDWRNAEDKYTYLETVARAGCPVPKTLKICTTQEFHELKDALGFPVVVKTRSGHGARGVEVCHSASSLEATFFNLIQTYQLQADRWPILQEYLPGKKYKLDGVFRHGEPVGLCPFEILRCKGAGKFGTSTLRRTVEAQDIVKFSSGALSALNWHGMFNTDWICDEHGVPHLIDVNGRLSGAVGVCYEGGVDLPWYWYQVAAGIDVSAKDNGLPGTYVRWILGDCIALVEQSLSGRLSEVRSILTPIRSCRHDDFELSDPLPFLAQAVDYMQKFVRAKGSLRPIEKEMIY